MGNALLMLDDLNVPIKYMKEILRRDISWSESVREAAGLLESNPEKYAALLI